MRTKAAVGLLLLVSATGGVRQPPVAQFRSDVEAVRVDVLVSQRGHPLVGLTAADFELFDNGVLQRVEILSVEVVPVNTIFVLDVSESVAGDPFTSLVRASRALVDALRPIDRAAILTFSHEITEQVALTDDRSRLVEALSRPTPGGNTSLYDAVYAGTLLRASDQSRTLLLVFSDGNDTSSWLEASSVLQAAIRSDVVIYAVALEPGQSERPVDRLMRQPERKWRSEELRRRPQSNEFLVHITEKSGGRLLRANERDLPKTFAQILTEFQNRYLLTYTPHGVEGRGWHQITVRVKRRGAEIRARRGYWR